MKLKCQSQQTLRGVSKEMLIGSDHTLKKAQSQNALNAAVFALQEIEANVYSYKIYNFQALIHQLMI